MAVTDDVPGIGALFPHAVDLRRLRWLLSDPERPGSLRSFVAVEGHRIVGHVGYTLSRFNTPCGELTGLFCIHWLLDASCRGLGLGSRLFSATFPLADFSYEYGGTDSSQRIFGSLGFEQPFHLVHLVKVLRPLAYARVLTDRWPRRIAKAVVFGGLSRTGPRQWRSRARDVALAPHDAGAVMEQAPGRCIANTTPAAQVRRYLRCPAVTSAAFTVTASGKPTGTALCLVREHAGGRTGRLLHLSYLGEDRGLWRSAIAVLEAWFADQGCATVSVLACHPHFTGALRDRGYLPRRTSPFWLRDGIHDLPRTGWHLTAFEGDVGDRGF